MRYLLGRMFSSSKERKSNSSPRMAGSTGGSPRPPEGQKAAQRPDEPSMVNGMLRVITQKRAFNVEVVLKRIGLEPTRLAEYLDTLDDRGLTVSPVLGGLGGVGCCSHSAMHDGFIVSAVFAFNWFCRERVLSGTRSGSYMPAAFGFAPAASVFAPQRVLLYKPPCWHVSIVVKCLNEEGLSGLMWRLCGASCLGFYN